MNKANAQRIFVAAQDDPVLAAWAWVVHEHRMSPTCDVAPHDHWEAFQYFFTHGLITPFQYDRTDVKRVFFSGRRPPADEVQRVLDNLRVLPEHQEFPMSNAKFPDNPFSGSTALTARDGNNGLAHRSASTGLPAPKAPSILNPFALEREVLPQGKQPVPMEAFGMRPSPASLPCRDSGGAALFSDVDLKIFCCGQPLEMEVADMQAEGPDALPGGQVAVIDRVLHGKCKECEREHHHSVGEVVRHEGY